MKLFRHFILLVIVQLFLVVNATAYSAPGHYIIAKIAFERLDPAIRSNVLQALDGMTFEQASTWMDEVKRDGQYGHMRTWHFINIPKGEPYKPVPGDNLMNALHRVFDEFADGQVLTPEKLRVNTLILFHLIGDLHQPLHVGYAEDRGGNDLQVNINGYGSNLHKVWDEYLIKTQSVTFESCMQKLEGMTAREIADMSKIDMVKWWDESRALLDDIYNFSDSGSGHKMSSEYLVRMKPVVETLLIKAGLRLAAALNLYFAEARSTSSQAVSEILTIDASDAVNHVGEKLKVCGKVFTTRYLDYSAKKPTFLNLGAPYPNQNFTIVIMGINRPKFSYLPEERLKNEKVCATGRIQMYKGKPQMELSEPSEIEVQ